MTVDSEIFSISTLNTIEHGALTLNIKPHLDPLLRLALRFHIFSCRYRVNATPERKNFVPFSNSAGRHRMNGFMH